MARTFYPWTDADPREPGLATDPRVPGGVPEDQPPAGNQSLAAPQEARIAVLEDWAAPPRIVYVEPQDIRPFVEELTQTTYSLAKEQGGAIPFMVIREIVENLIHAHFTSPVVAIWPGGNTIRFSDRGPGIPSKEQALEFGTTTATPAMKRYIRGVGFGLPYVRHFMDERGGTLAIDDNLHGGTVVTIQLGEGPQVVRPDGIETRNGATVGNVAANAAPDFASQSEVPSARGGSQTLTEERTRLTSADRNVISYLREHDRVGPRDLARAYGGSEPTWSRRLADLERRQIVEKCGQKRELTARGRELARRLAEA